MCVMSYRKQRDTKLIRKTTAMPVLKKKMLIDNENLMAKWGANCFPVAPLNDIKLCLQSWHFPESQVCTVAGFSGLFTTTLVVKRITFNCDPFNLPHRHDKAYRGRQMPSLEHSLTSGICSRRKCWMWSGHTHYHTLGVLINPAAMVKVHAS